MNIEQLQYICAVAQNTSITAAAEKLFVTQQTISRSIGKLESELGFQLLNRNHKGVRLTENGKTFVEKSEKILAQFQELYFINSPTPEQADYCGSVIIYCSDYFTYRIAPKLLVYFSEHYPQVHLHFEEHIAKDATELALVNNHLGYITTIDEKVGYSSTSECLDKLQTIDVYDDEIMILCSKNHELARKDKASLGDLGKFALTISPTPGIEVVFSQDYGIKLNVLMYSNNLLSSIETIRSGLAIGLITRNTIAAANLPDDLLILPILEKPNARNRFVYPKDYILSSLEKEVIKQSARFLANF